MEIGNHIKINITGFDKIVCRGQEANGGKLDR